MFLSDDPIQKIEDDELGRTKFVEELAQSLLLRDIKESLVVSLDGPWGAGKSSVLNLLEKKIHSLANNDTVVFRFDPWYFNSTEKLLQSFLDEIRNAVENKIPGGELKRSISKYKKILTSVQVSPKVSFIGIELSLGNIDIELENPEKIRKDIKNQIIKAKSRVVILIDNLDRLDVAELLLMFKLVRLCSDFPGFTFILALDKQQIISVLSSRDLSMEFIEKIIQVDINLPAIEQFRVDNFVFKGLEWIADNRKLNLDSLFWTRFSQIYQVVVGPKLVTSLRDAKRFLNTVDFSLPIIRGEVNYADFLILQVLRVFFPRIYEFLPHYKSELTKRDILATSYEWRKKERIAVFTDLSEKIQNLLGDRAQDAKELLGFLFPSYKAFLQSPQNPSMQHYTIEYEKKQLIASPEYFDRYFTMKVAGDDIPTSEIQEFVDRLNSETDRMDIQAQFLAKYRKTENLVLALKKLYLQVDRMSEDAKLHFIRSLTKTSSTLSNNRTNYWESEISETNRVLTSCIVSFPATQQAELLMEIVSSSESLLFSVILAQDGFIAGWYSFSDETRSEILECCRERIHRELVEQKIDIFALYPTSFAIILDAWGSKEFLNEDEVRQQYTAELLENTPEYVIKILSMYVWVVAGTDTPGRFGYDELSARYRPTELKRLVDNLDLDRIPLSMKEQFAVTEFNKFYDSKLGNDSSETLKKI